jgi:hypothetical protein
MSKRAALLGYVLLVVLMSAGAAQSLSGTNTVDSGDIQAGEVKGSDIAANVVTGDKIKDGSITPFDIKDGVLGGPDVANNSLTGDDINESSLQLSVENPHSVKDADNATGCETNPGILCLYFESVGGITKYYGKWIFDAPEPATYLKDPFGFVHIEGRVLFDSGSAPGGNIGTMFWLPAGYRPPNTQNFLARCNAGGGPATPISIYVSANGSVGTLADCRDFIIDLDGISFRAAS